jgi:hypothetical protein
MGDSEIEPGRGLYGPVLEAQAIAQLGERLFARVAHFPVLPVEWGESKQRENSSHGVRAGLGQVPT